MNGITFLVFIPLAGICLGFGAGLKAIKNETLDRFIPFLCALFGAALSVVAFYTIPNYIPADNWLMAIYVGVGSGLMATGAHQVYKQFTKKNSELVTTIEAFEELNGEYSGIDTEEDAEREG